MIKVDKLKVEMDGNAVQIAKELCYGLVALELVAKKLSEIAKRAYAETKDERSWKEVLN